MQLSRGASTGLSRASDSAPPSYEVVAAFHVNADVDSSTAALHHTAGPASNQSAPGDHVHDGGSSSPLLQGVQVGGVRGSAAYYTALEAALQKVGASITATGP